MNSAASTPVGVTTDQKGAEQHAFHRARCGRLPGVTLGSRHPQVADAVKVASAASWWLSVG